MLAAFLAAVFFALSAIIAHRTGRMVGVVAANCARLWVATFLLAVWAHGFGQGLQGRGLPFFLLSGVVGFGIGDIGLFAALPRLGSRLTALMVQCLASPIAATMEWLWLGTRPTPLDLTCGAMILVGVGIAVAPEPRRTSAPPPSPQEARRRREGVSFGLMAAVGQAGGAVISRKAYFLTHAAGGRIDGGTAAYQRALGGVAIVTGAYLFTRRRTRPSSQPAAPWRAAWPWIVANALVGATIGVSFYQWALATTPSAIVLPIVALTPLIVVPLAFVLEHERPSARSLLGGALAVAAAVTLARLR